MGNHARDRTRPSIAKSLGNRSSTEITALLSEIAVRLRYVYAIGMATEMALRKQNAERDAELADCLQTGVCEPAWDLGEKAGSAIESLRKLRRAKR